MLCCYALSNWPTGFWCTVIPVCSSNAFVLLKNHTTKQVVALRESVYIKGKGKGTECWSCISLVFWFYISFSFTLWWSQGERKWKVAQSYLIYCSSLGATTSVVVGSLPWAKVASWVVAKAKFLSKTHFHLAGIPVGEKTDGFWRLLNW